MRSRAAISLLLLLPFGCEENRAPPAAPKRNMVAEWHSIVTLRANQRTLLAAGTGGRVFVAQPEAERMMAVQSISSSGDVRPTQLAPLRVAQLIEAPGTIPQLRAIVPLDDGRLIAYYGGTHRTRSLACMVMYDPASESLHLIAGPSELARASEMGLTLDLAEAQLALSGDGIWLWLRHVDQSVFLRIDARQLASGEARLARPFTTLRLENEAFRPDDSDRFFGQIDGTLYLLRRSTGDLWRMTREGRAFPVEAPKKLGRTTAPPLTITPAGEPATRLWFFADPLQTNDKIEAAPLGDTNIVRYPALLIEEPKKSTQIDRTQMEVRTGFPLHAMRINHWTFDRGGDRIIAYDAMSGEVLRLQFTRK